MSGKDPSSLPRAVRAVVEPCCRLGLLDGFLDQVGAGVCDQLVARGLFLLITFSCAGPQPNGALSVEGRGRSEEAIETGLGLLGSLSEKIPVSSTLELNILNPRPDLAPRFRARAGALPAVDGPPVPEPRRKVGMPHPGEEKLIRRDLLVAISGSSVERGKDWLWPCLSEPNEGPSCIVFPLDLEKFKRLPSLEDVGCSETAGGGDPIAPKSALGELRDLLSFSSRASRPDTP